MIVKQITLHKLLYSAKGHPPRPIGFDLKNSIYSPKFFTAFSAKEEAERYCESMNEREKDRGYSTAEESSIVFDTADQCEAYKSFLWQDYQVKHKIQEHLERATPSERVAFLEMIEKMLNKPA